MRRPLGLATGRTMEPVYAALVKRLRRWSTEDLEALRRRWLSFNLDEYCGLDRADPRNYRQFMVRHLGEPLQLPIDALQLPDGAATDPTTAAAAYRSALQRAGGIGVQLLGLGNNGHVGWQPPCRADQACVRWCSRRRPGSRTPACLAVIRPGACEGDHLGLQEILAAEEIHLVVTGPAKAEVLQRLISLPAPDQACRRVGCRDIRTFGSGLTRPPCLRWIDLPRCVEHRPRRTSSRAAV